MASSLCNTKVTRSGIHALQLAADAGKLIYTWCMTWTQEGAYLVYKLLYLIGLDLIDCIFPKHIGLQRALIAGLLLLQNVPAWNRSQDTVGLQSLSKHTSQQRDWGCAHLFFNINSNWCSGCPRDGWGTLASTPTFSRCRHKSSDASRTRPLWQEITIYCT